MNLIWLDDFLVLAASGNFSRAAELRHMTQPAFSRRIRALEDWLGVVLFDRSSHPATLTEAGEWFRAVAQDLKTRVDRIPDEARAVVDASAGTLRIAATHALSFTFLPGWLRGLESQLAVGPVQLVSDVMQQGEALLAQGRVQFLLCHGHAQVPDRLDAASHRALVVGTDRLLPVSAADASGAPRHALAQDKAPILAYSAESGIGRLVRSLLGPALARRPGNSAVTAHLASVLRTLALDGRGIAWLPHSLVADDLAAGRLVLAGGDAWQIAVEIRLMRPTQPLPPTAERFWRAAAAAAARAQQGP